MIWGNAPRSDNQTTATLEIGRWPGTRSCHAPCHITHASNRVARQLFILRNLSSFCSQGSFNFELWATRTWCSWACRAAAYCNSAVSYNTLGPVVLIDGTITVSNGSVHHLMSKKYIVFSILGFTLVYCPTPPPIWSNTALYQLQHTLLAVFMYGCNVDSWWTGILFWAKDTIDVSLPCSYRSTMYMCPDGDSNDHSW